MIFLVFVWACVGDWSLWYISTSEFHQIFREGFQKQKRGKRVLRKIWIIYQYIRGSHNAINLWQDKVTILKARGQHHGVATLKGEGQLALCLYLSMWARAKCCRWRSRKDAKCKFCHCYQVTWRSFKKETPATELYKIQISLRINDQSSKKMLALLFLPQGHSGEFQKRNSQFNVVYVINVSEQYH